MLALAVSLALVPSATAGSQTAHAPSGAAVAPAAAATDGTVDTSVASHCARAASLVGSNCSYTTGMMARRVIEEGQDWTYIGELAQTGNDLANKVAAPYSVADGFHVIANELVEVLSQEGHANARLSLAGRLLEVDGVRYVVLTSFRVINS